MAIYLMNRQFVFTLVGQVLGGNSIITFTRCGEGDSMKMRSYANSGEGYGHDNGNVSI